MLITPSHTDLQTFFLKNAKQVPLRGDDRYTAPSGSYIKLGALECRIEFSPAVSPHSTTLVSHSAIDSHARGRLDCCHTDAQPMHGCCRHKSCLQGSQGSPTHMQPSAPAAAEQEGSMQEGSAPAHGSPAGTDKVISHPQTSPRGWLSPFLKLTTPGRASKPQPTSLSPVEPQTPTIHTEPAAGSSTFTFSHAPSLARRSKSLELPSVRASFFICDSSDSLMLGSDSHTAVPAAGSAEAAAGAVAADPRASSPFTPEHSPAVPIPRVFLDDNPFPRLPSLRDWAITGSSSSGGSRYVQRQPSLHDWFSASSPSQHDSSHASTSLTRASGSSGSFNLLDRTSGSCGSGSGSGHFLHRLETPPSIVGFGRPSISPIPEGDERRPAAAAAAESSDRDASPSHSLPPRPRSQSNSPTCRKRLSVSPGRSGMQAERAASTGSDRSRSPATKRSHSPQRSTRSMDDARDQPKSPRLVYHSPYDREPPVSGFAARAGSGAEDIAGGLADFRSVMDAIWGASGSGNVSPTREASIVE